MHTQNLDTTDPVALEAALEAAPLHTLARVESAEGEVFLIHRVPGGWHLPGDLTVTSGDVAEGRPTAVSMLMDEDYRHDEGLMLLAEIDPDDARDVATWAEAQRSEYLFGERDGQ
ncbi:MAG TPA: hypothetical protein VGP51_05910 [Nocardioidaceae bacterium]|jgi:hypothetical protein|nr:hypothetical protein [Nocardioidaceae bacterium]